MKKEFNKSIVQRFEAWTDPTGNEKTFESFINFLIGSSIITEQQIVRFMVVDCYPKLLNKHNGRKMRTLYSLENIVPRKTTQINSILKHYSKLFRYKKNLLE
jgi:hypothetical protein